MTLSQIVTHFFAPPQPADFDVYPLEYAPECGDIVISILRDKMGKVTAIGYPFNDKIERWFVEGKGWTAWLSLEEII